MIEIQFGTGDIITYHIVVEQKDTKEPPTSIQLLPSQLNTDQDFLKNIRLDVNCSKSAVQQMTNKKKETLFYFPVHMNFLKQDTSRYDFKLQFNNETRQAIIRSRVKGIADGQRPVTLHKVVFPPLQKMLEQDLQSRIEFFFTDNKCADKKLKKTVQNVSLPIHDFLPRLG